jgi:hypothetical protein
MKNKEQAIQQQYIKQEKKYNRSLVVQGKHLRSRDLKDIPKQALLSPLHSVNIRFGLLTFRFSLDRLSAVYKRKYSRIVLNLVKMYSIHNCSLYFTMQSKVDYHGR